MSDPATPRAGRLQPLRLALVALGALVALDQVSKQIVVASLTPGEERNFFLGLDLVHVRNDGVAFGFLSDGGTLVVVLTALSLAGLISYFAWRAETPWLWLPVGMILGGALGNLADRAREGAVIDFVDPIAWPAFNLADAAIVLGVFGLLYVAEGGRGQSEPNAPR